MQIERALREVVRGEVRFDPGTRALYATDGSNYRQVPIGVVIPRDEEDVIRVLKICRENAAPVLNRGCGTSLAGQCCNIAVILDYSKYMHHVLSVDPDARSAWVQPGTINDSLQEAAKPYGLTFGPDPATHNHCTIGGMIGNNSCGVHSVMAGKTSENIEELEILTYDGQHMRVGRGEDWSNGGALYEKLKALRDRYADQIRERFPKLPRRVSGFNLDKLLPENGFHVAQALVGTESTCVTVLAAKARLVPRPPKRTLLVLAYRNVYQATDHLMECLEHKPIGLEGLDARFMEDMRLKHIHPEDVRLLPDGGGWLLVEFGGATEEEADEKAHGLIDQICKTADAPAAKIFDDPEEEEMIWKIRESALGATAKVPGQKENWEGWEDSAVPPEQVSGYLRALHKLYEKHGYHGSLYGHFGDGCVHTRIDFDLKTKSGVAKFRSFLSEAVDTVLSFGGSLSGEHGDGQSRAEFLPRMFGDELVRAFGEFKSIWDPEWKMNPGKVVEPFRVDQNLRYGPEYNPPQPATHFAFSVDDHSFAHAMERCVGIGDCRRLKGGTMCPSYMVTREEKHSTRGRARLLFEMLQGNPLQGGWKNEEVKDALDLCLSCKGCKGDCPVNVDMAAYKAEFLSHYYEGRLRPRHAYASGLIFQWARMASIAPWAANFVAHAPVLSGMLKRLAGYAPERELPRFAGETFRSWWRKRAVKNAGRPPVVLWSDTFTNYFQPEVAQAGVAVLEDAGFQVQVPRGNLCCGRPLYDYGMLDRAKQQLIEIVGALRPQIQAETPVVVLEPGCASVFRDEMTEILWGNVDASRLKKQVFSLGEFLEKKAGDYRPPAVPRKVYVHGHCHQKSAGKMKEEQHLIRKMGAEYREIDSGCCGMAGAFGYEAGTHYDVSMACAERALLPAVRAAEQDALIVSDGFSCREQIQQTTGRQALHLAQVVRIGIGERDGVVETRAHGSWGALWVAAAALAIGAALRLGSRHR